MAARGRARLKPAGLREPRTTGTARGGGERRPNGAPGGGGGYPGAERSREPYPREGGRSGRKARGAPRGEPVPSSRELMEIPRREPGLPNSRGPPRREPGPSPRDLGPPSHREPELRPREPRRPRNRDPGPNYRDPQDPYVRELELSPREPRRPLDGESELGRWYKRGHPNRDTGPGFHDLGGSPNREPIPGFHDFKGHRFREPEQDTPETREPFYRESGPDLRWPHNSLPVLSLRESRGPPTREHGLQNIAGPPTREAGFGQCDPEGSLSRELGLQNLREPYNRRVGLSRDETVASNRKEHELSLPDLRGPHRKDMHFTPYSRQQKVNPQKPLGSYSTQLELGPHLSRDPYGRRETGSDFHEPREPYNRNFSQHLQDPLSPYNREPELFSLQPRDPNYRKHEVASKIPNGPCNGEIELRVPVCRSSYGDSEHSRLPRQDPYGRESVLDTEESDKLGYKKHTIAPQLIHGPGSRAYDLRVQQYTASCSRDLEVGVHHSQKPYHRDSVLDLPYHQKLETDLQLQKGAYNSKLGLSSQKNKRTYGGEPGLNTQQPSRHYYRELGIDTHRSNGFLSKDKHLAVEPGLMSSISVNRGLMSGETRETQESPSSISMHRNNAYRGTGAHRVHSPPETRRHSRDCSPVITKSSRFRTSSDHMQNSSSKSKDQGGSPSKVDNYRATSPLGTWGSRRVTPVEADANGDICHLVVEDSKSRSPLRTWGSRCCTPVEPEANGSCSPRDGSKDRSPFGTWGSRCCTPEELGVNEDCFPAAVNSMDISPTRTRIIKGDSDRSGHFSHSPVRMGSGRHNVSGQMQNIRQSYAWEGCKRSRSPARKRTIRSCSPLKMSHVSERSVKTGYSTDQSPTRLRGRRGHSPIRKRSARSFTPPRMENVPGPVRTGLCVGHSPRRTGCSRGRSPVGTGRSPLWTRHSRDCSPFRTVCSRGGRSPVRPGGRGGLSPVRPGSRGGLSPVRPGSRGGLSPVRPGSRGGLSPVRPGSRGGRSPVRPGSRGGRSPLRTGYSGGCSPDSINYCRGPSPFRTTHSNDPSPLRNTGRISCYPLRFESKKQQSSMKLWPNKSTPVHEMIHNSDSTLHRMDHRQDQSFSILKAKKMTPSGRQYSRSRSPPGLALSSSQSPYASRKPYLQGVNYK